MTLGASSSSLTPLTLQAVAAIIFVAAVALLLIGMLYLVLASSVAWALMVLQGLLWLAFQGLRRSWTALRQHVVRVTPSTTEIPTGTAPDVVLRPSH